MSIGEFASRSRLSPKALRLYDELGLLPPARVDEDSGYRYYAQSQLDRARLIAALRQLEISLAEIKLIVDLEPVAAAGRISKHWTAVEARHTTRRDLAHYLVDRMQGKRQVMYEVATRDIPARSVLCLKRTVDGWDGAWVFGKEFISILREHHLPMLEGRAGAFFCIYWGEVSDDSDGPLEWCRPIPSDQAEQIAVEVPELALRSEPAHREAFIHLGRGGQVEPAEWQLISQSLHGWGEQHRAQPGELGARITCVDEWPWVAAALVRSKLSATRRCRNAFWGVGAFTEVRRERPGRQCGQTTPRTRKRPGGSACRRSRCGRRPPAMIAARSGAHRGLVWRSRRWRMSLRARGARSGR